MRKVIHVTPTAPQFTTITGLTYAQTDSWFGHCMRDLKLDLIYPEDASHSYPCVVWICGGAWLSMDRSAHLAYLAELARSGFVVASPEYRTSNETQFPGQLQDVKAAIRYLRAHAARFHIDPERIGTMGESAGGYLTAMTALANDPAFDTGAFREFSSAVQAAVPWYVPASFPDMVKGDGAGAPESLLLGKNVVTHPAEAEAICPVHFVSPSAPPMMMIHGNDDHTVPFDQSVILYNRLDRLGCDVTLIEIDGADHADIRFFQEDVWKMIIDFFHEKLGKPSIAG